MNHDLKSLEELRRQWRASELQELRDQAFVMKANLRFVAALEKQPAPVRQSEMVMPVVPRAGSFARKVYDQFNGVPRTSLEVSKELKCDSHRVGDTTAQLWKRKYLRRVSPGHYIHAQTVASLHLG